MTVASILAAAVAVLPSDRMAMADRLLDKGDYARAKTEYVAVKGAAGIPEDEIIYRLAECDRLSGDSNEARMLYSELLNKYPLSRHANRSQLMKALLSDGDEKINALRILDSDRVEPAIRARALYNIGITLNDRNALKRCVEVEPNGPYFYYAKFHASSLAADDPSAAVRRTAIEDLWEVYLKTTNEKLKKEALYSVALRSYKEKRYDHSSRFFRAFLKSYSDDSRSALARNYAAWSDYLAGKYSDAASLCGDGSTDETAYLLAASAYGAGDRDKARGLMERYLEKYPAGKFRKAVELPLARMSFEDAEKSGDAVKMVETARRAVLISKSSFDKLRLAWAYEKNGRDNEAISEYVAVAKDFSGTENALEALYRKALLDIKAGRWSAAEMSLAEMLSCDLKTAREGEALYWRGICAVRLGHESKGSEYLKAALKKSISLDSIREAKLVLADIDFKAGRIKEAREAYRQLVNEGATSRMSAAKLYSVGQFLLSGNGGEPHLEEAKLCARAILAAAKNSPEWKQLAFDLLGRSEEAGGELTSAIGSYRQALAENVCTERRRIAALNLGILLCRSGESSEAETVLKEAVNLNGGDSSARARAYLYLAKVRELVEDRQGARDYATVVTALFNDPEIVAEAQKILNSNSDESK